MRALNLNGLHHYLHLRSHYLNAFVHKSFRSPCSKISIITVIENVIAIDQT